MKNKARSSPNRSGELAGNLQLQLAGHLELLSWQQQ